MADIEATTKEIVRKSVGLKDKFTGQVNAPVEFASIFCQSDKEYKSFDSQTKAMGRVVEDTPTGFTYLLRKPIKTTAGPLYFLKIRKPDPARPERGDADFDTNYSEFKKKYGNNPKFELIKRDNFEMLRLSDSNYDVMSCFSNLPKRKVLRIDISSVA